MSCRSNTSVLAIAKTLKPAFRRLDRLDEMPGKRSTAKGKILLGQITAIEDRALMTPAKTLADAAVQIMLAYCRNEECFDGSTEKPKNRQIAVALHSALVIVAETAGLKLAKIAGDEYLAEWSYPSDARIVN